MTTGKSNSRSRSLLSELFKHIVLRSIRLVAKRHKEDRRIINDYSLRTHNSKLDNLDKVVLQIQSTAISELSCLPQKLLI